MSLDLWARWVVKLVKATVVGPGAPSERRCHIILAAGGIDGSVLGRRVSGLWMQPGLLLILHVFATPSDYSIVLLTCWRNG